MSNPEIHQNGTLTLEVRRGDAIAVVWRGLSTARDPGQFVLPILVAALDEAAGQGRALELDFRGLEYLNSSTITPLIRVLERARRGEAAVTVIYRADLKWQAVSFSALTVFSTPDGRIAIRGA